MQETASLCYLCSVVACKPIIFSSLNVDKSQFEPYYYLSPSLIQLKATKKPE